MIRSCTPEDFDAIRSIINEAALVYRGVIPDDCWHEPYMPSSYLQSEMQAGVKFWAWEEEALMGVMGIQRVEDATLIRHAYVSSQHQGMGVGKKLLTALIKHAEGNVLVGAWAAATWAIRFYEKNGFCLVSSEEKERLLRRYWTVSPRQIETSVVLTYTHPLS